VTADVGDEDPPALAGELEEVVVVATGVAGGLVVRRQLEPGDLRQFGGQ